MSPEDKIYFNHAIISAHERYGNPGVHAVIKQITDEMHKQAPDSPWTVATRNPAGKEFPTRSIYDLHDKQATRINLCNINWEDKAAIENAEKAYKKLAKIEDDRVVIPADANADPA